MYPEILLLPSLGTKELNNCRSILVLLYTMAERGTRIQEHLGTFHPENSIPWYFAMMLNRKNKDIQFIWLFWRQSSLQGDGPGLVR